MDALDVARCRMTHVKRFEDLHVRDVFSYSRTSGGECALFVAALGEFNPYRTVEGFARAHCDGGQSTL